MHWGKTRLAQIKSTRSANQRLQTQQGNCKTSSWFASQENKYFPPFADDELGGIFWFEFLSMLNALLSSEEEQSGSLLQISKVHDDQKANELLNSASSKKCLSELEMVAKVHTCNCSSKEHHCVGRKSKYSFIGFLNLWDNFGIWWPAKGKRIFK